MNVYKGLLRDFAQEQRKPARKPLDQDHLDEVFAFRPPIPVSPPMVLLGGMGPLAGAGGFERACQRFLNTREIVLFQACSTPDRTEVVKKLKLPQTHDCDSREYANIIDCLGSAIKQAVAYVTLRDGPISLIVLCNTSHLFLDEVLEQLRASHPNIGARIEHTSLIKSAIGLIKQRGFKRVMALYTEGTKLSQVYSRPLEDAGISCIEKEDLQPILTASIYDGVKAFDNKATIRLGTRLFDQLLTMADEFDCILAGCTEIPFIIESLNLKGNRHIRKFLRRAQIIDPVIAALESVALPTELQTSLIHQNL